MRNSLKVDLLHELHPSVYSELRFDGNALNWFYYSLLASRFFTEYIFRIMAVAIPVVIGVGAAVVAALSATAVGLTIRQHNKLRETLSQMKKRKEKDERECIEEWFERKQRLGEGGFGVVYAWKHIESGLSLAAKEVDLGNMKNLEVLITEADVLTRLNHENVIYFYQIIVDSSKACLFMELMQSSVGKEVKDKPFSEDRARLCTRDIMNGLIYLHENGVIHCDIKGDNVLLNQAGKAKLTDFGLAKFYSNATAASYGQMAGTMFYMSPEILMENKAHGKRSDLWAVACTVYEMLTQHAPFAKDAVNPAIVVTKLHRMEHRGQVDDLKASSNLKDFLHSIFVKFDKRPYPEKLKDHKWLK